MRALRLKHFTSPLKTRKYASILIIANKMNELLVKSDYMMLMLIQKQKNKEVEQKQHPSRVHDHFEVSIMHENDMV